MQSTLGDLHLVRELGIPGVQPVRVEHPGGGELWRLRTPSGTDIALKRYADRRATIREWDNLTNVTPLPILKPTVLGMIGTYLAESWVHGELADAEARARRLPWHHYEDAIRSLVVLHTGLPFVHRPRELRQSFSANVLKKTLDQCKDRVEIGISAWTDSPLPERALWRQALEAFPLEEVWARLVPTPETGVLGHGDYKPDNLIITSEGVAVLDWLTLSRSTPWYDLAYLTIFLAENDKAKALRFYLDIRNDFGKPVPDRDPENSFRLGQLYQQLVRAASNGHLVNRAGPLRAHHRKEFSAALGALGAILGDASR